MSSNQMRIKEFRPISERLRVSANHRSQMFSPIRVRLTVCFDQTAQVRSVAIKPITAHKDICLDQSVNVHISFTVHEYCTDTNTYVPATICICMLQIYSHSLLTYL